MRQAARDQEGISSKLCRRADFEQIHAPFNRSLWDVSLLQFAFGGAFTVID